MGERRNASGLARDAATHDPASTRKIPGPMFEYTALVDAPVRRFTGIVTGSDADDEPLTVTIAAQATPPDVPVAVSPAMLAAAPEPIDPGDHRVERFEPTEGFDRAEAPASPMSVSPAPRPAPTVSLLPTSRPLPAPSLLSEPRPLPAPSLRPALLAIAAAGITAVWWLRREPHDR